MQENTARVPSTESFVRKTTKKTKDEAQLNQPIQIKKNFPLFAFRWKHIMHLMVYLVLIFLFIKAGQNAHLHDETEGEGPFIHTILAQDDHYEKEGQPDSGIQEVGEKSTIIVQEEKVVEKIVFPDIIPITAEREEELDKSAENTKPSEESSTISLLSIGRPASSSVRGNLGPASVITEEAVGSCN